MESSADETVSPQEQQRGQHSSQCDFKLALQDSSISVLISTTVATWILESSLDWCELELAGIRAVVTSFSEMVFTTVLSSTWGRGERLLVVLVAEGNSVCDTWPLVLWLPLVCAVLVMCLLKNLERQKKCCRVCLEHTFIKLPGDTQSFQHDVQKLFIFQTVDENVDRGVDNQCEMVDMHKHLDPSGPMLKVAIQCELNAFVCIQNTANTVTNHEDSHDQNEHHCHLEKLRPFLKVLKNWLDSLRNDLDVDWTK